MLPNLSSTLEPEMAARVLAVNARYIRFGPFQVDQQRQEVSKNGVRLKVQGKVYQVLMALIEKPGEVVTREELRMRLWPADTHVNYDANVNTTVNKLRQALGDSSDRPLYVETIPRKGYCLVVRPEFADVPVPVAAMAPFKGSNAKSQTDSPSSATTGIWMTLGILALIVGGMLLGAAITRLWIQHFAPLPGSWF
jgi:DNA-binding winged helix-turn-helix (wHTH) protein